MDFELSEKTIKDSYYQFNQEGVIDLQSLGPTALECKLFSEMNFKNLVQIGIARNYIGNEGIRYLISGQWLSLRYLDIHWNYINLVGIKLLSRGNWQQLIGLFVSGNQFGLNGCRYLIKGKWPKLRQLGMTATLCFSQQEDSYQIQKSIASSIISSRFPFLASLIF